MEEFLKDPPIAVPDGLRAMLPTRGVLLVERVVNGEQTGVWDIWDKVGKTHYPNVADFVEEVRRMGVSRKLAFTRDEEWEKITPETRLILWHDRAGVVNWQDYGDYRYPLDNTDVERMGESQDCVQDKPLHACATRSVCCASIWWNDLLPDDQGENRDTERLPRSGYARRRLVDTVYYAYARPEGVQPVYVPSVFAVFPPSRIAVVKGDHARALQRAHRSKLDVAEVDF